MLSPVGIPNSMTTNEVEDIRCVDEFRSKQSDSMQLSLEISSKMKSMAVIRDVCCVSSKKLPGIFSKVLTQIPF
jgi:hypothetical protein